MPGLDLLIPFAIATALFAYFPGPALLYTAAQTIARPACRLHGGARHPSRLLSACDRGGLRLSAVLHYVPTLYIGLEACGRRLSDLARHFHVAAARRRGGEVVGATCQDYQAGSARKHAGRDPEPQGRALFPRLSAAIRRSKRRPSGRAAIPHPRRHRQSSPSARPTSSRCCSLTRSSAISKTIRPSAHAHCQRLGGGVLVGAWV